MSFALLFVAFVTPVQVSLLEPGVDGVFVVGFLVDFIFLAARPCVIFLSEAVPVARCFHSELSFS